MGCDCASVCPHARHCAVMEILEPEPGESRCVAFCDPDPEPSAARFVALPLDTEVRIDTRNIELAALGEFLANFCEEDVLIPARSASKIVEFSDKNTTLGAVLERAGLVVGPAPKAPQAG
jgi:hypothetical protein